MRRLLVLTALAAALTAGAQQRIVRLWNNASAPHDNGLRGGERVEEDRLFNTTEAVLYVYAADPARATGQAAVVCPGGGYRFLSIGGDGHAVGRWLAEHGVTAAVLKYRLPNGRCEVPLEDTEAALRYLRRTAPDFCADSAQVGIVGCSAGGHLAASAATMLPEEVRPAFAVLIYPVITAEPGKCHKGSFDRLLGTDRTTGDEAQWSQQNRVTASTPPALLLAADDDRSVPPVNSVLFYAALKRHGIPASLRIYPSGGHGGALDPAHIYRAQWRADILDWLAMLAHENQKPTSKPR